MTSSRDGATAFADTVKRPLWRRFRRDQDGTAVIEFGILAIPFFLLIFATIESFIAFAGEQLLDNAVATMARELRTGRITTGTGTSTDMSETEFKAAFCDEIKLMMTCDDETDAALANLVLDVREFSDFASIPTGVPRSGDETSELDTSSFGYSPGGAGSINVVRAYYRWEVMTDLVRPYITNVATGSTSTPDYFLMVATAAFQNEDYP
ncbi:TadE/TadG family type IV pilus assembly protein [Pseudohoeflea coraliihabitans]|uniref:Pilus assembly protein n=1 Tax=Pseudohoeflea coraliihabitans TaxID=2860393 RepID=A0ABS6WP97_9HYPH|nr:TadE/TadG family type IV pilus assembly protein [Pseudohoeflea sp. DP4N28-3]MBW3097789.1 pilus assembly protein [Pseudohoeflea sp. DP4N28-3]